jgi:hypothetical protein
MSKKSRLFLMFACIALVVTMLRFIHSITIPEDVADFAAGFAVAMLVGTMVTWSDKRGTNQS